VPLTRDGEKALMRRQKEDMEAEQQQLDVEMERRRRRVKEWQEKKRREQQLQQQEDGSSGVAATIDADGEGESGKKWTLDGEESDEEDANKLDEEDVKKSEENGGAGAGSGAMDVDSPNRTNDGTNGADIEEDEIDPLGELMNSMVLPEVAKLESAAPAMEIVLAGNAGGMDDNKEAGSDDEDDAEFIERVKKTKAEKMVIVDHSKIDYQPFRKNFCIG
jgi:ATP-dependent RNA helicase DDX46/PRP5